MPFDQAPQNLGREHERAYPFALKAPELKTIIVDAALSGIISGREAEDLISEYGLRHE